jgi:glycosyltransferase involved in cell wall biosynthesis
MRVLLIVHGYAPECSGGTESYVRRLATELRALRHEVEVVCGSHEGRPKVEVESTLVDGVRVRRIRRDALFVDDWDKSYAPEIEPALDDVFASFKPDVVHVHHWIRLSRTLIQYAHDKGVPAVCTLHDFWTTCPIAFRVKKGAFCALPAGAASCHDCAKHAAEADDAENAEALELFREDFRNELLLSRRVLFPSRAHKDAILAHVPEIAGKTRVEPFAPISDLAPLKEARRPAPDGRLRVRHWGHLSSIKGVDLLLRAVASLPRRLQAKIDLKLLGTIVYPHERDLFLRLAEDASATIVDGPFTHDDLRAEPADLAVFPSRAAETHSFVVDEAFQLGLPVVVPDRGAPAERIGRGGAIFRADDAASLAEVLGRAAERPELVQRWREGIPAPRSFAVHAASIADVYREVVGSSAPLQTTPRALRARRERFRSKQVETRTRKLDQLRGEIVNLTADVRRASETMAEMDLGHRVKDVRIDDLSARVASAEAENVRRAAEIARTTDDLMAAKAARDAAQAAIEIEKAEAARRLAEAEAEAARRSASVEVEAARAEARVAKAEAGVVALGASLDQARKEASSFAASLAEANAEIAASKARLAAAIEALAGREGAYAEVAAEARRLASAYAETATSRDAAVGAAGRAEETIRALDAKVAALEAQLSKRGAEVASLRDGLERTEASLLAQSTRAEEAEAKLREAEKDLAEHVELLSEYESGLEEHVERLAELRVALDELKERRAGERDRDRAKERATLRRLDSVRRLFATGEAEAADGEAAADPEARAIGGALRRIESEAAEALHSAARERSRLLDALAERDAATTELCRAVEALERRVESLSESRGDVRPPPPTEPAGVLDRMKRAVFGDDRRPIVQQPLKILFVVHQFLPRHVAGTEVYTHGLAKELAALGHRPALLSCEAHHEMAPYRRLKREFDGIPIHEVVQNYAWDSFEATYDCPQAEAIFEAVLDEEKPDVVHVQHLHYFSAGFLRIAARRGLPIVYTLHDYILLCARDGQMRREDGELCREAIPEKCADCIAHHRLDPAHVPARRRDDAAAHRFSEATTAALARVRAGLRPFDDDPAPNDRSRYAAAAAERLAAWGDALKHVDLFVSPSNFLKEIFVASGLIPADKILVSDNGQDLARFSNAPPRVRGPKLRVGYVGTIGEHKGVHVLIEAMNRFADDDRVECSIYGHLEAFEDYRDRLLKLNRNPRTTFKGVFDPKDVARIFSEFDVLVAPSLWWENSPLTVHEAALSRLPVLASDKGGLAEYVVEGKNGLRFFMGDAEDLRRKIAWLLEDRSRLDAFTFDAFPIVPMSVDARKTADRYRELLANRATP